VVAAAAWASGTATAGCAARAGDRLYSGVRAIVTGSGSHHGLLRDHGITAPHALQQGFTGPAASGVAA